MSFNHRGIYKIELLHIRKRDRVIPKLCLYCKKALTYRPKRKYLLHSNCYHTLINLKKDLNPFIA